MTVREGIFISSGRKGHTLEDSITAALSTRSPAASVHVHQRKIASRVARTRPESLEEEPEEDPGPHQEDLKERIRY